MQLFLPFEILTNQVSSRLSELKSEHKDHVITQIHKLKYFPVYSRKHVSPFSPNIFHEKKVTKVYTMNYNLIHRVSNCYFRMEIAHPKMCFYP